MRPARLIGSRGHDAAAESRLAEIDEVLDAVVPIRPTPGRAMLESFLLAYAALASLSSPRTVVVSKGVYDEACKAGFLEKLRERYPDLTIVPPAEGVRGMRVDHVIIDELADFDV